MRKFYKALLLVLALLLMITVFAVVSFADENEESLSPPYSVSKVYGLYANNFDAENYTEGYQLDYSGRTGAAKIAIADNGNKYAVMQATGTSGTAGMWDIRFKGSDTTANIVEYPTFMLEFDVMTQGSSFEGASVYPRLYSENSSMNFIKETKFNDIGLSTEAYKWQHVSVIVTYNGDETFTQYTYVNGEFAKSQGTANMANDSYWLARKANPEKIRIDELRFYTASTYKVGIDNIAITYFTKRYDLDTIANYNYKGGEGYVFPYGQTVATLTDNETGKVTYYDNYEEAYAAKNDSNTFKSMFAAEYINANGKKTYVKAEDFATTFNSAAIGSKIVLRSDVTVSSALTFAASANKTLDLNGYKLYRLGTSFTDYEAVWNEATGSYEKGAALESPAAVSGGTLFSFDKASATLNLTSSRPGAEVYSVSVSAERLLLNGEVVASLNVKNTTASNICYYSAQYNTVNIDGKNITFYANSILNGEHGAGTNCSFNIDGGTYVKIHFSTNALLHFIYGGTHTIKNATFVSSNYSFRHANSNCTVTIDNCDFLGGNMTFGEKAAYPGTYTITNSRITASIDNAQGNVTVGNMTRLGADYSKLKNAEGNERIASAKTITYTIPKKSLTFDPITLMPIGTTETVNYTFKFLVSDPEADLATVTYKDWDGNVISSTKILKGEEATPPAYALSTGDGYTGYSVSKWLDKDGKEFNHIITMADEQVYTAARPTEDAELTACINEAMMSFSYVAQFHMYFYLPVVDGMERPTITVSVPSASGGSALVNGQKYWVYTWWCGAPSVSDDKTFTVNFTLDGKSYTQVFTISALIYAEIVLSDPASDEEALAVANMVRYIKEARIAHGDKIGEKFDELIGSEGLYPNLPAYEESYPDDSLDTSVLNPYLEYITLSISGTPNISIRLTDKAVALGMTKDSFKFTTKSGVRLDLYDYAKNGKNFETNNTKIYNLIETFTIVVTVPEEVNAETGEVIKEATTVSCKYSIGTYIKGAQAQNPEANLDLARAAYSFGVAVKNYRNSVKNY